MPLPDSRDLLDKLTLSQLVEIYPKLYVTQRFITVFRNNTSHLFPHPGRLTDWLAGWLAG